MSDYVLVEKSEIDYLENTYDRAVTWKIIGVFRKNSHSVLTFLEEGLHPSVGWPCSMFPTPKYRTKEVELFIE